MRIPLKIAILESGTTQRALSVRTSVPETRLSAIVTGRVNPTHNERELIAAAIGKPVEELFGHMSGGSAAA